MKNNVETKDVNDSPVWSIKDAVLVIAGVFAARLVVPFSKMDWLKDISLVVSPESPQLGAVFISALFQAALILAPIFYFIKFKYDLSWSEVGLKRSAIRDWFWVGMKQGLALFVFIIVTGILITALYPVHIKPQPIAEVLGTAREWRGIMLSFLVASVVAPVSEEIYFRGFFYPALRKIIGRVPALLLAASFFGLLHFDLLRFIPITLSGIWLTMLYEKTGSLYTSIIAHSTWNTLMTILIILASPYAVTPSLDIIW